MKKYLVLLAFLAMPAVSRTAHATHKNWVLKDSGAHCTFVVPDPAKDGYTAAAINEGEDGRYVECPVSLAGRWGASAPISYGPARWANSMWSNVYVETRSNIANIWCQAAATMASGSQYWGKSDGTAGRFGRVTLEVNSNNWWGGDLQTHQAEVVKALVYECTLPSFSTIHGYKAKICQRATSCSDAQANDAGVDSSQSTASVQESGFGCVGNNNEFRRGLNGLTNITTFGQWAYCPITPPSDDSYENSRKISHTRVYYSGGSRGAGCVGANTCPVCDVRWYDRWSAGDGMSQSPFTYTTDFVGRTFLEQPVGDPSSLGIDVNAAVECFVPPGVTINGVTTTLSTTRNSGGI